MNLFSEFLYTRLILDLMRLIVNHWTPLTHAYHCMTTNRPAAVTQMKVRVSLCGTEHYKFCKIAATRR